MDNENTVGEHDHSDEHEHHDDVTRDTSKTWHGTTKHDSDIGIEEAWSANVKRTYDEYQHESLETMRALRLSVAKLLSDAQQNDNFRQNVANQALQNAVETANMVSKQAVRHSDLAIDRQWNIDEVAGLSAKSGVQTDAMIALLAKAIADAMSSK